MSDLFQTNEIRDSILYKFAKFNFEIDKKDELFIAINKGNDLLN
jgi:hypothetical protein